jgi:sugar/nucleoside kinase (ribokinase family)
MVMGILAIKDNRKTIVGIGSALVDLLAQEQHEFLDRLGVAKGGMNLVDSHYIGKLISQTSSPPSLVPGGSACNTAIGVRKLGGSARFVGKLGQDELGDFFMEDLKKHELESFLFSSDLPTGCVLSIVTPDAQRSMFTYLGAAGQMHPEDVTPECFADAAVVHLEGYLLFNRELMLTALRSAKDAGALISLDLASFNVVEDARDILDDLIADFVDILIANEDEAKAYSGHSDEDKALEMLSQHVDIAALKLGPKGSRVAYRKQKKIIEPMGSGHALDTTGAGDLWASGFLYGLVHGYSIENSGRLASACGYEVCQVMGASIPEDGWERIRKLKKIS